MLFRRHPGFVLLRRFKCGEKRSPPPQWSTISRIHSPVRLVVMSTCNTVGEAEFGYLRERANVSDSLLSKHVAMLADAGYVVIRKGRVDGAPITWIAITDTGRRAFGDYRVALSEILGEGPR